MSLHPDFADLLAAFADAGVRYLLVGGYAVAFHARPRATKDIDLWVAGDDANLARVASALAAFGAPSSVVDQTRRMTADEIVYMGVAPLRVDVLRSISGVEFEDAFSRRAVTEWDGITVSVIGIDDLIANKREAARPQDLLDVVLLERVRQGE
jgi:predicted nucleotidyltransferase